MYAGIATFESVGALDGSDRGTVSLGNLRKCISTTYFVDLVATLGSFALLCGSGCFLDLFLRFGYLLGQLFLMIASQVDECLIELRDAS